MNEFFLKMSEKWASQAGEKISEIVLHVLVEGIYSFLLLVRTSGGGSNVVELWIG